MIGYNSGKPPPGRLWLWAGLSASSMLGCGWLTMDYPGFDGFLGTRASLMLDVVFLAMFAVIPVLGWSIYQVKFNGRYLLHKRVQVALALVLAVAVTLFETEIRIYGWEDRAAGNIGGEASAVVWTTLYIHLFFAVPTPFLWAFVIVQALRYIPNPPGPCPYSGRHIFWAKFAAGYLVLTALTGWVFYLLGFAFAPG